MGRLKPEYKYIAVMHGQRYGMNLCAYKKCNRIACILHASLVFTEETICSQEEVTGDRENCIMRSFIIRNHH
jgi:nitrate reductase NapAB chaperone NapD